MTERQVSSRPAEAPDSLNLSSLKALHPAWYYASMLFLAMAMVFLAAQWIDERTLLGVSVWSKPFKFSISLVAYFVTLLLMSRLVHGKFWTTRGGRTLVAISLFMALGEMVYIIWQAALGEPSHFNDSTTFHRTMYSLMAVGAVTLVSVLLWYAVVIAWTSRWQLLSQPIVLAVTLGLFLTFTLGGGFGVYLGGNGSHFVGPGTSDANGLWLVKWSREFGDLRVAHFFGMHAMQAIPLFALLLPPKWPSLTQSATILAFSAAYILFTVGTFLQALYGQPFLGGF